MPKPSARSSSDRLLRTRIVRYLEHTSSELADLLAELRDSLDHNGAGPRREAETVLREIEFVPGDIADAAEDLLNRDETLW